MDKKVIGLNLCDFFIPSDSPMMMNYLDNILGDLKILDLSTHIFY